MNDIKQLLKYNLVTSIIAMLLAVSSPFIFRSLGIGQITEYESITYKVKEVYEEKNQSIYGTWRTYYVVEDGTVFKVSSEEYYSSKSTGKFTQKKVK